MDAATRNGATAALKVCAVQGGIAVGGTVISGALAGADAAVAALFGGVTAVVPTLYFGWRLSVQRPGATPAEVLGVVYRAELVKLALTVLLLGAGVTWFGAQFLPLILTFSAGLLVSYAVAAAARW
jgi:F0F1-type ATP synthase assembly protein I